MAGEPKSGAQKDDKGNPPPRARRPAIIRVFRSLHRQINKKRRARQKEETQHQVNERMMARWTRRVGWFTGALVLVGIVSAWIFHGQLKVMQGQLDSMATDQRPWLALDVAPAGPLLHDANGWDAGVRWHLSLNFRIKNVGRTPATDVAYFASLKPIVIGIGGISIPGEFDHVCGFWEKMQAAGIGHSELLFPQEEWPDRQFIVNGNEADFDAARKVDGTKLKYLGQFLVTACVVYRPAFPADFPYRTGKEYYVGDIARADIDLSGPGVPIANLGFHPNPTRGVTAR